MRKINLRRRAAAEKKDEHKKEEKTAVEKAEKAQIKKTETPKKEYIKKEEIKEEVSIKDENLVPCEEHEALDFEKGHRRDGTFH